MKYVFILILPLLWIVASCSSDDDEPSFIPPRIIDKAFVQYYVCPKSLVLNYGSDYEGSLIINIHVGGSAYSQYLSKDSAMFWKYAYQYGDTAYNKEKMSIPIECCTNLNLIDITCDKDVFGIPKEHSLSEITEFRCKSYRNYIKNNYKNHNDIWITKKLSEMNGDDYLLLNSGGSMELKIMDSKKIPAGEYKFTVTLMTDEDEIVKEDIVIKK